MRAAGHLDIVAAMRLIPCAMNFEPRLRAAEGYSELGMPEEALLELDSIPEAFQERPPILQMRLLVLMSVRRWADALEVSRVLCVTSPGSSLGFIHAAFCLHEMGRTRDARQLLLDGPAEVLQSEATYFYNLGCYHAVLGDVESARADLEKSFAMEKKFRALARRDPDLKAVWKLI